MDFFNGVPVGVNLGGWLSQYPAYDHRHFQTFITAADIRQIADWGMDHVRLPVDYPVLEDDAHPGAYLESGLAYVDQCLEWCAANGLGAVLDLHNAPGYSFTRTLGPGGVNPLFNSSALQEQFLALWEMLARRYVGRWPSLLVFELLNEVVLPDSAPWNRLAHAAAARIRAVDTTRPIMVGSNHYSAIHTLQDLKPVDDPHIIYTFHFYEPLLFTHQKAAWDPVLRVFDTAQDYPAEPAGLAEFVERHPEYRAHYALTTRGRMDAALLRRLVAPALEFRQRAQRPLYCGEFGVIDRAPREGSRNWHRDLVGLLREAGIGRAVWSYKQMDFGLVDGQGRVVDPELVKLVSAR